MGHLYIEEISSYTQQFSKKFRQRILIFHPLERWFNKYFRFGILYDCTKFNYRKFFCDLFSILCLFCYFYQPGVTLFRSSYLLLAFSILFEVGYIYIGYEIWRKGIWNFKNDTTPYTA
ncbi:hypothetical protein GLOIN_2v1511627 [Rhizophagus irregularis DAOM 181602=DAOM 197198]|nr:hypothetical protein GLOIN_2v1511627 [Rhizophagus irregularis DAOM 181602=DAOM 197198]